MSELTEQEAKIVQMFGDAWNEYLRLPVEHPNDQAEMCAAVHVCQRAVLARSGRRQFHSALKSKEKK